MRLPFYLAFISTFTFAGIAAGQQPSNDSLVAAARRAREEKTQQPKTTRVWDNDNIPKKPDEITILNNSGAQTPGASDSSAPAATAKETESPKDSSGKKAAIETDLASAKENLQTLQNDLDILKRKLALDQQSFFGKPNYTTDKDGAASLSDEQDQIDKKQLDMGAAQQKIADLQSQLNGLTNTKPSDK